MVGLTLLWGSSFVVSKEVLATLPVALLAALRSGTALASLLWVRPQKSALVPGLWLGLLAAGGFAALMTGLATTSASKAAFIFALNALIAPLVSALAFRRSVPKRAYVAALVALLGLGLMTLAGPQGFNPGDVWSLVGALLFGLYIAYVGEVTHRASPLALVQVQYAVMALVMVAWAWPLLPTVPAFGVGIWPVVLYLGIFCMSLPTVLQVWAQRVVPPHLAALLFLLEPVFANLLAFAWLRERLSGPDLLGAGLILAALVVCTVPVRAIFVKAIGEAEREV